MSVSREPSEPAYVGIERVGVWGALALGVATTLLAFVRPFASWAPALVAGAAFGLSVIVAERRLRRSRPFEAHGRMAPWRHPSRSVFARLFDALANSRLLSAWLEPLPIAPMVSEIRDVVYVNYLVPAGVLERYVPWALELERLGEGGRWALFSFLTYRHGHFSFRGLGPLRRLFPSPVQTNWRVHVRDPRTGIRGVYFVTNAIEFALPALAARLFTEGMPMHVFARSRIERDEVSGDVSLCFEPGAGTAPDALASFARCEAPTLDGPWRECFGDWKGFLNYCVPQNRAMSAQRWHRRVTRHEISLPIANDRCQPLLGEVDSRAARAVVGDAKPLCFCVEGLSFAFEAEVHDAVR